MDKYGSHVLDTIFTSASLDTRTWICEELVEAGPLLSTSFHAGFVRRNCAVDLFRKRREEWVVYQRALVKELKTRKGASSRSTGCNDGKGDVATVLGKRKGGSGAIDEIDDIFRAKK